MSDEEEYENAETIDGIEDAQKTIKTFLLKGQKSSENEEGLDIILAQYGKSPKDEDPIEAFRLNFETDVDELTEEILNAACDDVSGMKAKKQKYTIRAPQMPTHRGTFTLKCNDGDDEDIDDIEDNPNRKGLMGMFMRHQQGLYKLSVGESKSIIDMLMEQLKTKDELIIRMQEQSVNNLKQYEELISGRHARDIELRRIERKEERMDKVAGTVLTAFPMLMSQLTGGGANAAKIMSQPGARTPLEMMLEGFMNSMNEEQLHKIMGSGLFSPDQMQTLMMMVKFMIERQEEEEKMKKGAQNGASQSQAAPNGQGPASPSA